MTALLLQSELWPDRSSLRTLPVERVTKLMWFHHEPSELVVWSEGRRVGHLRLEPKIRGATVRARSSAPEICRCAFRARRGSGSRG
jgi:hypothetical protein